MDHRLFMQAALEEARRAFEKQEVPVGAVLVRDGAVIARNHNRTNELGQPGAHAEALVIREAAETGGDWRLEDTALYCTLEPCLMCAGLIVLSRIPFVYYGAWDKRFGAFGSVTNVLEMPDLNHYPEVRGGVLAGESERLLLEFFRTRRESGQKRSQWP